MSRRKAIPQAISTQYFSNVTPLWRPPAEKPIPDQYHDAVYALADWAGPEWADNAKTDFFMIRQVVIGSCEAWRLHDWVGDLSLIRERKANASTLAEIKLALQALSKGFSRAPHRRLKIEIAGALLRELGITWTDAIGGDSAKTAVENAIRAAARIAQRKDRFPVRFGPVEYDSLPNRLPAESVAIALSLADRITFFRKDGHSKGYLTTPHRPNLSVNLPWKSIALFASSNVLSDGRAIEPSNAQTRVESLISKVARVYWS